MEGEGEQGAAQLSLHVQTQTLNDGHGAKPTWASADFTDERRGKMTTMVFIYLFILT